MLIRPTEEELADFGEPDFVIYNAGVCLCVGLLCLCGGLSCVVVISSPPAQGGNNADRPICCQLQPLSVHNSKTILAPASRIPPAVC